MKSNRPLIIGEERQPEGEKVYLKSFNQGYPVMKQCLCQFYNLYTLRLSDTNYVNDFHLWSFRIISNIAGQFLPSFLCM